MTPESMYTLWSYQFWASELMWEGINQLSDEQFLTPIHYSMGSIQGQVLHIAGATRRWLRRINGQPLPEHYQATDFPTRQAVHAIWDNFKTEMIGFIDNLDQTALDHMFHWELPHRHIVADNAVWEILLHVANHATEHRAQVMMALNQLYHINTPEQDMMLYLLSRHD